MKEDAHFYEVLYKISEHKISVIPILKEDETYAGCTSIFHLMMLISNTGSIKETGGILVLEVNQIENKTVILFMSDNGGLSAVARGGEKHMHNIPLKSGKGSIYEGGIRVPMLAYWPNKTKPETINTSPLIIEDFFPSILDIAQLNAYNLPQTVDGHSFIPQLVRDDSKSVVDRPLFWHYPNEWGIVGPRKSFAIAIALYFIKFSICDTGA